MKGKGTLKERYEKHFGMIPSEWHFRGNNLMCVSSVLVGREEEVIIGEISYEGSDTEGYHHHIEVRYYRNMHKVVNGTSWKVISELVDNVSDSRKARKRTEALVDSIIEDAIMCSQFYGKI